MDLKEIGFFGNLFVRQHRYDRAGQKHHGHAHHFDHVTIVASGSVLAEVDGCAPRVFKAPTFITIKKELRHRFTALEDNTVFWCVFSLRDVNGDVTDVYSGDNSPYGAADDKALPAAVVFAKLAGVTDVTCPGCTGCTQGGPGCSS